MVTGKAKAAIRRYVRSSKRDQFIVLGQEILEKMFKNEGLEFSEKSLTTIMPNLRRNRSTYIYAKVGEGLVSGWDVMKAVYPAYKQSSWKKVVKAIKGSEFSENQKKNAEPLKIEGADPGNGDAFCRLLSSAASATGLSGIVTTGKGVAVHTVNCKSLERFAMNRNAGLTLRGGEGAENQTHTGRLKLILSNEPGSLGEISNLMARNNANISNLNIVYRTVSYFEIIVDVDIRKSGSSEFGDCGFGNRQKS